MFTEYTTDPTTLHDGIRRRYGQDAMRTGDVFSFVAWCLTSMQAQAALRDAKGAWHAGELQACLSAVERACEQADGRELCHLFPLEEYMRRVVANCG